MSQRVEAIERLGKLLDEGKLTRSEYDVLKAELLDQQAQPIPAPSGHIAQSTTQRVESEEGLSMAEQPFYNGYDGPRSDSFYGAYHRILADASIVPPRGDWQGFALSFNGYEAFDGEPDDVVNLYREVSDRFDKDGDLSRRLSLAELRAVLFFQQRLFRQGEEFIGAERELIDVLLDEIRLHAGADRSLDPTPQTKGERFARRVLAIAHGVRRDTHLNTPLSDFDPSALGHLSGQVASEYGVPASSSLEWPSNDPGHLRRPRSKNVSDLIQAWLPYVVETVQGESSGLGEEAPPH